MTITAKNIGRINVWPTYSIAREADTGECEFVGQLTVWPTYRQALANISHEEEGGGEPDWVPDNAKIHIDLERAFNELDAAWVDGVGVVAVDTLLGSDANTENGWGGTAYHSEYLVADGYLIPPQAGEPDQSFAFVGAALTRLLAGATVVFRSKGLIEGFSVNIMLLSASGNAAVQLKYAAEFQNVFSWGGDLFSNILGPFNNGASAINVTAFTVTPTRFEHALNGCEADAQVTTEDDYPTSGEDVINAALMQLDYETPTLQSITLYDALPSTAGLSEFSEIA